MNKNRFYTILAIITIFFWGTTFVSTKVLLNYITPIQVMLLRYLIAYVGLFAVYPKFHRSEGIRQELLCMSAALTGSTLYFLSENTALYFTQASNVSLLISAAPILTSMVAHLFTRDEKLSRGVIYGFLVAMLGIFFVVFNGHFVLKLSPVGDLLAITAALMWAFYTVILRKIKTVHKPVYMTRRIFFYSILTMLPCLLIDKKPLSLAVLLEPVVLGNLVFLGLIASSLCYVLWYHVVGYMGAVKANNFIYLNPLVTMLASIVVLREQVTWLMLLGAVLILLGVMLAEGPLFRRQAGISEEL
ncbi:DMT family transporter [Oscillospiraceae bacterium PP1C4]